MNVLVAKGDALKTWDIVPGISICFDMSTVSAAVHYLHLKLLQYGHNGFQAGSEGLKGIMFISFRFDGFCNAWMFNLWPT